MPIKRLPQFTAWSYSRLQDWEACPFSAKLKHLDKIPTPAHPAMARGSEIHKTCEKYTAGEIKKLPEDLGRFGAEFDELRKGRRRLRTEMQLGLDRSWEVTEWFGRSTWCRIVVDALFEFLPERWRLIDYKTGKVNPAHKDQLSLYAIGGFALAPKGVDAIATELWYLDQGEQVDQTFARSDVPKLKTAWEKRAKPMLADVTFKPTPGDACRWCHFAKAKGGQCKF
jgi:hypothetical protein